MVELNKSIIIMNTEEKRRKEALAYYERQKAYKEKMKEKENKNATNK